MNIAVACPQLLHNDFIAIDSFACPMFDMSIVVNFKTASFQPDWRKALAVRAHRCISNIGAALGVPLSFELGGVHQP